MKINRMICMMLAVLFIMASTVTTVVAEEEGGYTYFYDFWGEDRESPDTYRPQYTVDGEALGIGHFKEAASLFVRGQLMYIVDSGNNRIVVVKNNNYAYELVEVIDSFITDDETMTNTFLAPNDVFVSETGDYYICDTENQRIVHINENKELVKVITRPKDNTIGTESDFFPLKIVVDDGGRLFVLVKNYNKGFVQFKDDGSFAGYMGANEVKFDIQDYLWKLIATKEQREQMEQFVPTEYNNLAFDKDGFIYCTTSIFDDNELRNGQAKPVRKLNAVGTDILVENGEFHIIGDINWDNVAGISGPSKLVDVTVLDNDVYYALDKTRGRIFAYDSQGNLLYAFGGIGNREGYFQYPVAIEHMGKDLYVLDGRSGLITVLAPTDYGWLINDAIEAYNDGDYYLSADYWDQVLLYNGNYDMAYIGLGRAYLRQGDYDKAMAYFELKLDDHHYSKAFMLERKTWIENNIWWIITLIVLGVLIPPMIKLGKRIRKEVKAYESSCL